MNISLVVVRPHACRQKFIDAARNHFDSHGIRVDDVLLLSDSEIRRGAYVERHFVSTAAVSASPSSDLSDFMSEEAAANFCAAFGESWQSVASEGRILTSEGAMVALGDITAAELNERWWNCKARVRIEYGFYVSYFKEEKLYVINGFYPQLLAEFTEPGAQTCLFIVSWPESKYTWARFRLEILGTTDPKDAETTSLRWLLRENWESYGLREPPTLGCNGFDSSSGPLEAMAQRFIWLHRQPPDDDFGRALLQEGISEDFVSILATNPTLCLDGDTKPVFELMENMQSSEVLLNASVMYAVQEAANKRPLTPSIADSTVVLHTTADWTIVLDDEDAEERRNRALVFIKPHANTRSTRTLVSEHLLQVNGLEIVSEREISGSSIAEYGIIDKHYGTISKYAIKIQPMSIPANAKSKTNFFDTFGVHWDDVLRTGRVWNAETAQRMLGNITGKELNTLWSSYEKTVKIIAGAYVKFFQNEGVFVINGFYPYLRDSYNAPEAVVTCFVVAWLESVLTWSDFRNEIIGPTNPGAAPSVSLRGMIRDRWRFLGLQHRPDTTDNGVHASAGPLEGALERNLWLCHTLSHDPLSLRLRERGLTGAMLHRWASNPLVVLRGNCKKDDVIQGTQQPQAGNVFDLLENIQTSELVDIMCAAEKETLATYREVPTNRAVVVVKPFATGTRAVDAVRISFAAAGVRVVRETVLYSCGVKERFLGGAAFRALEHFASAKVTKEESSVSNDIKEAFAMAFQHSWNICLAEGMLMGADAACEQLQLTPAELLSLWSDSEAHKLAHACFAVFIPSHDAYVLNGFVPFVREMYARRGSHVHLFDVSWPESAWTWRDFFDVVIGNADAGVATAAAGSLQRILSDDWDALGLKMQPTSRATAPLYASRGPLEAVADREIWFADSVPEDAFVQHLLLEGVPLSMILPLVHDAQPICTGDYARANLSRYQQSSEVVRRLKALSTRLTRGLKMNYAFLWVKPHAGTKEVLEWIPRALEDHRIAVLASGHIPITEVIERQLVDQQYNALYRNAMDRNVTQIPLTTQQGAVFHRTFGITWATALRLHLVINAAQAVNRIGTLRLLAEWDAAPHKVCLSPALYVAFLESEGLYVINGFYPYLRSRIYTGPRIHWFSIAWDSEIMTWPEFQSHVIGSEVPDRAERCSLRRDLSVAWRELGLERPPDGLDNGFYASASPIEGLADRVTWLGERVETDVFGRLLLQGGVEADYIRFLLQNPLVRHRDEPVGTSNDVFDKLCTENPLLLAQLVGLQTTGGVHVILHHPSSSSGFPAVLPPGIRVNGKTTESTIQQIQAPPHEHPKQIHVVEEVGDSLRLAVSPLEADDSVQRILPRKRPLQPTKDELAASFTRNYAVVFVNPKYVSPAKLGQLTAYMSDFLQSYKLHIELQGCMREVPTSLRGMYAELCRDIFKYAVWLSPTEYVLDDAACRVFLETFDELWDPSRVRNAVDVAVELGFSAREMSNVWDTCSPRACIAPSLYIGRMRTHGGAYITNGFALHAADIFHASSSLKPYFIVSWEETGAESSYESFMRCVIGNPTAPAPGSLHDALRRDWHIAGFTEPPDAFEGAVVASTSALEAIRQRSMWLSLDVGRDPLAFFACSQMDISPYTLRWAAGNPRGSDGTRLIDAARWQGSAETLRLIAAADAKHRRADPRNSAFLLVKSHALCRPFARTIEAVLARAKVNIDEEGDLNGLAVRERGLVHHLYASAERYAMGDVTKIKLSLGEREEVRKHLHIDWKRLVDARVLHNAYRALEVLGGISSGELYRRWNAAPRRVVIRPDLIVAELAIHGIFVVNGFFPEMRQSFDATNAVLHWYAVSWEENNMDWATFHNDVIGCEDPEVAKATSIRGQLHRRWREFGIKSPPSVLRNGLHASQGPLQAMRERTQCLQYPIAEDYLGDLMLRSGVPERVLRVWLDDPLVTTGGVEAGAFEHLRHCGISRLMLLMKGIAAQAGDDDDEEGKTSITSIPEDCLIQQPRPADPEAGNAELDDTGVRAERVESITDPGDSLLHRNTAVVLVKPHVAGNLKVLALLERIFLANNIRVRLETRKQSNARLVEKHLASVMRYATHNYVHEYPEINEEAREAFLKAFGEVFEAAIASRRVIGAEHALTRFNLTPSQLFVKWSLPLQEHVQLAHNMNIVKFHAENVFVVNAQYPYERQRMIEAGPNMQEVHCYVVNWDQRQCSWRKFLRNVIGDPNPSSAADGSFHSELRRHWAALGLAVPPNCVDNGVVASGGPLQAYVEREIWCGAADLAPDPLVRAVCQLDGDPTQLLEWREDPLVQYTGPAFGGDGKIGHMFALTYGLDTRQFVDLFAEQEGYFIPISEPFETCEDGEDDGHSRPSTSSDYMLQGGIHRHFVGRRPLSFYGRQAARPAAPHNWVRDALQRGDVETAAGLWQYYGGSGSEVSERGESVLVTLPTDAVHIAAATKENPTGTINGAVLRRDIESLECFGQPLDKGTVKKMFDGMTKRGDGRVTYEEFLHILAMMQRM